MSVNTNELDTQSLEMAAATIIAVYSVLKTGNILDCHVAWPILQVLVNFFRFAYEFSNYFVAQYRMEERDHKLHNDYFKRFNYLQFAELFLEYEWVDNNDKGHVLIVSSETCT